MKSSGFIPLSEPSLTPNAWKYVKNCLDTGWVSSVGSYVEAFENKVAAYLGRKYAVATSSGTTALHTAVMLQGLMPNQEVILPALTFVAPAHVIRYAGAYPVFIDVEEKFWQINVEQLENFLKNSCRQQGKKLVNKVTRRQIVGIIPVHLLGHPVDMQPLMQLARKYNLWVIEDNAESLGASYKDYPVGRYGDITCLSFNGNKIVTSGGGGMIVTDDQVLAQRAKYLTTQAKDNSLEYIHHEVGYNYRMSNVLAALGLSQLEQLDRFVLKKIQIAGKYDQALQGISGLQIPQQAPWAKSSWWLYTVLISPKVFGCTSRQLIEALGQQQIQSRPLWCPLSLLKPYQGCLTVNNSVAKKLYQQAVSLPSSVGLSRIQQQRVIDAIIKIKNKYGRM